MTKASAMRKLLLLTVLVLLLISPVAAQSDACTHMERPQWDGQSRFNILVMGMDRRPGARDNLNARTDVMMLVSYDPQNQRIGILSIPRDMHFAVMGMDEDLLRVNTLMVEGELIQEGCGPFFAMETYQLNLGMYIDAYLAFDFEAFIAFVDSIGGITVDVPAAINDPTFPDMNYGVRPLVIHSGLQEMDGRMALDYARTRHGDNDYLRGQRQLLIIEGVRDRLGQSGVVQDLVENLPDLLQALDGHFYSNLPPEQLSYLGLQMVILDSENIVTGALNEEYSYNYYYNGERVRIPERDQLILLLTEVFGEEYWH
jgi:polyisoprenyl-teichoic acid--peptidoglycan teichoic acid transferase